jgi:phosphoribosylaminoimidazolecarboxamide formyltransferase/IMP cyclohydrolase
MTDTQPIIRRALLSVSDKTGIDDFARALHGRGVDLISTGGTAKALRAVGLPVRDVAELTGFPEMMDGRVKTLHPVVHGGLLAIRDNAEHAKAMADHNIGGIDLLVINLYPFEATIAKGAAFDDCVENIDIGGPAMIRGAAKNHDWVAVIVDPEDYARVLAEMDDHGGGTTRELRTALAAKAFARTAVYDAAISNWFAGQIGETAPRYFALPGTLRQTLRYGENPHQAAAFYISPANGRVRPGVATARQVQGKELSYNNLNDTDAAYELVAEFDPAIAPAVAIIKHANPCGVAVGTSFADAYRKALMCDPVKKNLRLLLAGSLPDPKAPGLTARTLAGGFLVQSRDNGTADALDLKVVTKRAPTEQELADMTFAFRVAKHVKSNTIVFAKDGMTAGIGAGQMSRVDSARIAAWKGEEAARAAGLPEPLTRGSAAASDAFFPFADGLIALAEAGATAVIQPGGSMRDQEVIDEADRRGLAMVFTGMRHFRH